MVCLQAPALQDVLREAETQRTELNVEQNVQRRELESRLREAPPKESKEEGGGGRPNAAVVRVVSTAAPLPLATSNAVPFEASATADGVESAEAPAPGSSSKSPKGKPPRSPKEGKSPKGGKSPKAKAPSPPPPAAAVRPPLPAPISGAEAEAYKAARKEATEQLLLAIASRSTAALVRAAHPRAPSPRHPLFVLVRVQA